MSAPRSMKLNALTGFYVFNEIVGADTISDPLLIPADYVEGEHTTVEISPEPGARGLIEYTTDSESAIENDTAIWWPWTQGLVAGPDHDWLQSPLQVTGLRCVTEKGAVFWRVRLPQA